MATTDSNTTQGERDTGFGCPHYEAVAGKKRCRHYLDGGSCARPDEFMCVEWLRLNKKAKPAPKTKGPTDLFGNPVPEPKQPKRTTPTQQRPTAKAVDKLVKDAGKDRARARLLKAELENVAAKSHSPRLWAKEVSA